jgi:hypothetical protein
MFVNKNVGIGKINPTQYTTYKTDIIKVALVFFDFPAFLLSKFPREGKCA